MERSKKRLLVNAEAFGYGPTAAAASFYPHLRERFEHIGFVGQGHALDLQRGLGYDKIHDTSDSPRRLELEKLAEICKDYDVFMTAMDFSMAQHAKVAGLRTAIYDAITWYWKDIPEEIQGSDLYMAQDFFGVRERLQTNANCFPAQSHVVSPIVPAVEPRQKGDQVLLNLGGLKHPFWKSEEAAHYAATIIKSVLEAVPQDEKLVIATSVAVTRKLSGILADEIQDNKLYNRFSRAVQGSLSREEIMALFNRSKYAFMTPGLGNIYDAARFDLPTIWLPPSNDSQGQQLDVIRAHGMSDGEVDWSDLPLAMKIDYKGRQTQVIKNIRYAISQVEQEDLTEVLAKEVKRIQNQNGSASRALIDKFGTGGERQVAQHVYELAENQL